MARFDTFVFDLDGTLLDTLPDLVVLTNAALNEQGFPSRTADEIHSFVGNGARALMYQAVPADASPEQAEAAMRRWMELYPVIGNKLTKPYPHMEETLAALAQRGIGLGVLSNKFDQGVHDVIDAYLPGLFPVQYGECDEIPRKPDPTGLLRCIDELGSAPARTAYVGDSPGDVLVSRNAGAFAIGVSWGYHHADALRKAGADVVIEDVRELLQFAVERSAAGIMEHQPSTLSNQPRPSKRFVIVSWALVAAWAFLIFFMSSNTGTGLNTGLGIFSSIYRAMQAVQEQLLGPGVDALSSIAHFCEYTMFGALLANALRCHMPLRRACLIAIACASLYGVSDEVHQLFVPERMCDPVDWMVDTAGSALGSGIAYAVLRKRDARS